MGLIDAQNIKPCRRNNSKPTFIINTDILLLDNVPESLRNRLCVFDTDGNNIIEEINENGENEFAEIMGLDLKKYIISESISMLRDNTIVLKKELSDEMSVTEINKENYSRELLKDSENNLLVEKVYSGRNDKNAMKIVYKHMGSGNHKFQVTQNYQYRTKNNSKNDLYKFASDKNITKLTQECQLKSESFLYNGKHIDPALVSYDKENRRYQFKDPDSGKTLFFTDRYNY